MGWGGGTVEAMTVGLDRGLDQFDRLVFNRLCVLEKPPLSLP